MATRKTASKAKAPAKKAGTKKPAAKKPAASRTAAKKDAPKAATKKAASKTSAKTPAKAPTKATTKKVASSTAATKTAKAKADKPVPVKSKLDKKFVDAQKKLLLSERERYVQSAITWKAEADSLMESREPGDVQFDEESGEGDSLAVERERDLALSAHARAAIEQIDEALERIEAGTYGVCTGSGKPIPKERLKAIPWAAVRVEYKAAGFRRR